MIDFSYQTEFVLEDVRHHASWLINIADSYEVVIESLGYVFCDDDYVHSINLQHLSHDTFTDIITFDYGSNEVLEGEIYISIDRVRENAADLNQEFDQELRRVMCHGLLHMIGFNDESKDDKIKMRELEDKALSMFHVKQ